MAFFLLGRGSEGELHLLSRTAHPTRKAALAELSELTADTSFPYWDDEVFVLDVDAGTPVLLMKPAGAEAATAEATETVVVEEADAEAAVVLDAAIADEIVAEAEEAGLKAALTRTAQTMEAEGIVAPESVGPEAEVGEEAEAAGEAVPETKTEPEAQWPWAAGTAPESRPEVELAAEPEAEAEEPVAGGMAAELVVIDEGTSAPTEEGGEIVTIPAHPDETIEIAEVLAETESAEQAPEAAVLTEEPSEPVPAPFVLDDLEAPAVEVSPLVQGVDDETFAVASQPVILDIQGPDVMESQGVDQIGDIGAVFAAAAEQSGPAEEAPATDDISAFIMDLETVNEIPETVALPADLPTIPAEEPAAPAPAPSKSALLPGVTCSDCVYEPTCPNKESRSPQECGSFQWKAL